MQFVIGAWVTENNKWSHQKVGKVVLIVFNGRAPMSKNAGGGRRQVFRHNFRPVFHAKSLNAEARVRRLFWALANLIQSCKNNGSARIKPHQPKAHHRGFLAEGEPTHTDMSAH